METTEVGGLRVAYERAGAGPALMLLHGYVGDGQTTWRRQLDELSDDFTVVAWDAPGAGGSSDPPEDFGIAGYADCLAEFIDTLRLDRPNVVGLSFGGILALALHHRYPAVPKALVLASAYAGWRGSLPTDVAEARLRQALVLADLSPEEFVHTLLPTMFSPATAADAVAAFRTSMLAFHPVGFRAMARASAEDLRDVCPGSASQHCCYTASRTSAQARPWLGTSKRRSRVPSSSSCRRWVMSATWRHRTSSTTPFAPFFTTPIADLAGNES